MTAAGIDVGKANLDLTVDGHEYVERFADTPRGIARLVKRLQAVDAPRIVLKASGGYEEASLDACCDTELQVSRVNPRSRAATLLVLAGGTHTISLDFLGFLYGS